jgi:hypothetical protein
MAQPSDVLDRLAWPHSFVAVKVSAEGSLPADVRAQLHFLTRRGDYKLFEMGNSLVPGATAARLPRGVP